MVSISGNTPDATTIAKGKVQLAGDLAGTAALPVIGPSKVTQDKVAAGFVVQAVYLASTTVDSTTTLIPADGTIPQSTEGKEFINLSITPKATTNRLFIEGKITLSSTAANDLVVALFQDSGTNAIAGSIQDMSTNEIVTIPFAYEMAAGTTSTTTFRIRGGGAIAGTTTFNGRSGTNTLGGILNSFIRITEVKV